MAAGGNIRILVRKSNRWPVSRGVPPGEVLGPMLSDIFSGGLNNGTEFTLDVFVDGT